MGTPLLVVLGIFSIVSEAAGVCKDLDDPSNCKTWANMGECKKNPNYMLVKCKKSCGKCPTTTGSEKPCYTPSWCFPNNKCGDGWTHELDKKCVGKGNVCCRPPPGKVYDCHSPNQCSYQKCWSKWSVVKDKTCPEPEKGFVCCKYTPTDKVTPKPTTGGMPCYQPNWCFPNNKCGDGWTHDKTKTCSGKDNVCCHPPAGKVYDCFSPHKCSYKKCWSNWKVLPNKTCPEPEKGFVCCEYQPHDKR